MIKTFGEILLRLSPNFFNKSAGVYIGGAEVNVCAALSNWKLPVSIISKIPANEIGDLILEYLQEHDVHTELVIRDGERMGTYYLMQGADLQHSSVVYDRNYSSFSQWQPGETDWETLLKGCTWFHWSAITPALNSNLAEICLEALKSAKKLGIFISVDLNYRSKLWQYGKQPSEIMPELVKYSDLIMGNIWAVNTMLNIPLPEFNCSAFHKTDCKQAAEQVANALLSKFPYCKHVAFTFRFSEGAQTSLFATLSTEGKHFISSTYTSNQVIDRVGSGDAFMAGLIYGIWHKADNQQKLEFATVSAYCKWHIKGDHTTATLNQIIETINQTHEAYTE